MDFNKVFANGINYQRLSDAKKVLEMISVNSLFAKTENPDTKQLGCKNYLQTRGFKKIGSTSRVSVQVEEQVRRIQHMVMISRKNTERLVGRAMVESYADRRKLHSCIENVF